MQVQDALEQKLKTDLEPIFLEVVNESGNHNVPPGSESHFKVLVVSSAFQGKSTIARHRLIYKILEQELAARIHALSLKTLTPEQWETAGQNISTNSPPCMHR